MSGLGQLPPVPSIQLLGLPAPPVGPENSGQWYEDALKLPATFVKGWFGSVLGSERSDGDVQLLFHDEHHLQPTLRLVISQTELCGVLAGIGNLLHTRTQLLPEWSLRVRGKDAP